MNINKLYIFLKLFSFTFIIIFPSFYNLKAQQYNVAGTATVMSTSGCYQLTNTTSQSGAVWNIYMINLTQPFDITLKLNFGNRSEIHYVPATCGADGMTFVLQPLSIGVFGPGGGVGYQGITPSLGVVMDTYVDNPTDPSFQHISIHKNGDVLHNTANQLVSYTSAVGFPANITDGLYHKFRFTWTPTPSGVGTMNIYFGTATTLPTTPTLTYTGNIVNDIFSNNPNVYWGVSGSTGGCWNVQTVCIETTSSFINDSSACVGDTVHFTSTSTSGLPIITYIWDFGDGGISGLQNPVHVYSNPGTYNVKLEIYNSGGFFDAKTIPITVFPKPNVYVTDTSICLGDTATIIATGALSYTWNNGLPPISINKVAPNTTSSYIVTGFDTHGCKNSDTSEIIVNPLPVITTINDTVCIGDTALLNVSGGGFYYWSTGDTTSNIYISPNITTNYTVIVTSNEGCKDSSFATAVINQLPQLYITPPQTICNGNVANITASGGSIYTWLSGQNTPSISVNPSLTTSYFVEIIDANGCISDTSTIVNVIENPVAIITSDVDTVCEGNAAILSATGGSQFLWNTGETNSQITVYPLNNTTYTCHVSNSTNGTTCSSTSNYTIYTENCNTIYIPNAFNPIGINNIFKPIGTFLPNTDYYFAIYNRWGQLIFESRNIDNGWDGTYKGQLVKSGAYIYYLKVKFGGQDREFIRTGTVTLVD